MKQIKRSKKIMFHAKDDDKNGYPIYTYSKLIDLIEALTVTPRNRVEHYREGLDESIENIDSDFAALK
jgi:hypothetical protein